MRCENMRDFRVGIQGQFSGYRYFIIVDSRWYFASRAKYRYYPRVTAHWHFNWVWRNGITILVVVASHDRRRDFSPAIKMRVRSVDCSCDSLINIAAEKGQPWCVSAQWPGTKKVRNPECRNGWTRAHAIAKVRHVRCTSLK